MKFHLTTNSILLAVAALIIVSCTAKKDTTQIAVEFKNLGLTRGEIALCGTGKFGTVDFSLACADKVREDFNKATALLHSFEYADAEKIFANVMDKDPACIMAYWGAAMCNFHPLWAPPSLPELEKGKRIITLARSIIDDKSSRESDYIEAIATIYDDYDKLDHHTRVLKFEKASENIFKKYPDDKEAAIFYALALDAAAEPADKSFQNQKKAGEILEKLFANEPNHPGIAHYLIHNYDYPELATLGLPAARKYASIASASAHAQHMPSHIFTRLGLWDEAIQSNISSVSSAQCYAQNINATAHWDEELHGLDYLVYAYLQKGNDDKAKEQVAYLNTIEKVFPVDFKDAYAFASIPARYALERRDWDAASKLTFYPANFPWDQFPWEKANIHFSRLLGDVHINNLEEASLELEQLKSIHAQLTQKKENYKADLVLIQVKSGEAWLRMKEGKKNDAIKLMTEAADMEDATAKHPVTPGEIIPARELLADLYMETGDFKKALDAYKADLARHPNRFNALYGAAQALTRMGDKEVAKEYYTQLATITTSSKIDRLQKLPEM